MQPDSGQPLTNRRRVTVFEAADILAISPEAVRARIKRGTLAKEKDLDGTIYVRLDDDQTQQDDDAAGDGVAAASRQDDAGQTADQITLIEALQAEVKFLREKLQRREAIHTEEARRKDTIITTMAQRISELEAALESRESPVSEPPGTVGEGGAPGGRRNQRERGTAAMVA